MRSILPEHLKRLKGWHQPYFTLAHVHQLEIVEQPSAMGLTWAPEHEYTTYKGQWPQSV
jgi:hypothetical protein